MYQLLSIKNEVAIQPDRICDGCVTDQRPDTVGCMSVLMRRSLTINGRAHRTQTTFAT